MTTETKKWTVNTIKEASRAAGSHWFDPDTMRSFGTVVLPTVYQGEGGIYFVTKDDQYRRELPKRYTVRRWDPEDASIDTVGELGEHVTPISASEAAKELAGKAAEAVCEDFRPVSVLEQFVFDLDKHSSAPGNVTQTDAKRIMTNAKSHHSLMERVCNGDIETDENGEHAAVSACRARIEQCAARLGCKGVIFSGDPRGCTVKLTFKDGYTNDFGNEGYCVPIEG